MSDKIYFSMIYSNNRYFIPCNNKGEIHAYKSMEDGINDWEKIYHPTHEMSMEASATACIHYIFYSPTVVELSDINSLRENVILPGAHMFKLQHVSGNMTAIACEGPKTEELYNSGNKPRLVDDAQAYGQLDLFLDPTTEDE
jgi:hypothetical protein